MRDGFKMTEIGIMPNDWDVMLLKDVCNFRNGKAHEKDIDSDGDYIVINSKFISTDGKVRKYTTELLEPLYIDEIVMVMSDVPNGKAIAKCFYIDQDETYTLNQRICGLKVKHNFHPQYIYRALNRNPYLLKFDDGVKQTNLRKDEILACPIRIPPLPEQQKIADILTTVDAHVSETEALIEKTKALKQGLMQQLLTKGIGHTEFKDTEIGRIPVEWESTTIGNLSSIYRGASPRPINDSRWFADHSSIGWIRIADVTRSKKYLRETTQYLSNDGVEKSRLVERGKLIMSICGTIGRPIIIETPSCIHDGFIVFEDIDNRVLDTEFLYYWVLENEEYFRSQGQKGTQANINTDIVKSTFFAHPPIEEQRQIAAILTSVDDQIETYQAKLTSLTRLKTGLMQQLLTGKIRVTV